MTKECLVSEGSWRRKRFSNSAV